MEMSLIAQSAFAFALAVSTHSAPVPVSTPVVEPVKVEERRVIYYPVISQSRVIYTSPGCSSGR